MNRPTASPPHFPYREHRNMAQVMAAEARMQWEFSHSFRAALARPCPRCGVAAGQDCRSPNGRLTGGVHSVRRAA